MRAAIFPASETENITMTDYINYSYNNDETKFYVCWETGEYLHPSLSSYTPLEIIAYDLENVVSEDYADATIEEILDTDGNEISEEDYDDIKKYRYIVETQFLIDRIQDHTTEWFGGTYSEDTP